MLKASLKFGKMNRWPLLTTQGLQRYLVCISFCSHVIIVDVVFLLHGLVLLPGLITDGLTFQCAAEGPQARWQDAQSYDGQDSFLDNNDVLEAADLNSARRLSIGNAGKFYKLLWLIA